MALKTRREKEKARKRLTNAKAWADKQDEGFAPTCFELPKGVELYKFDAGTFQVDFLPYKVGKGNPSADEGMVHFERQYHVHRIPMPNGRRLYLCCLYRTFGKKCPVCSWVNKHGGTADKDLLDDLKTQQRHLWLVNVKPGNTDKPKLAVMDTIYWNRGNGFGEMLKEAVELRSSYQDFAELEGGKTVEMRIKKKKFGKSNYFEPTRFDFIDRDYDYPRSLLDKLPCLDDLLIEPDPKEMLKALDQAGSADEDDDEDDDREERRGRSRRRSRDDEDEEEEDKEDEDEEEEDEEDDEDEENRDHPRRRRSKEDEDEEDEDEEEEDEDEEDEPELKKGDYVTYDGEECEVLKVDNKGKLLLEDEDGKKYKQVDPDDCEKVKVQDDEDEEEEDDGDEEDDDDDDRGSNRRRSGKADKDAESEDSEDEEEDREDEEDEEEDVDEDEDDKPRRKKARR